MPFTRALRKEVSKSVDFNLLANLKVQADGSVVLEQDCTTTQVVRDLEMYKKVLF